MSSGSVKSQIQKLLNEPSLDSKDLTWPTICRAPKSMYREDDPKRYVPELVSIGPLHYRDTIMMQDHKVRFFVRLLKRVYGSVDGHDNELKKAADKMVNEVRKCYSDRFDDISDSEFSWMIVVDACFVLELFRFCYNNGITTKEKVVDEEDNENDEIFRKQWIVPTLRMDFIKMENQLPYFVLQQLYDLMRTSSPPSKPTSLTELAANFFAPLLPFTKFESVSDVNHAHIISFLHTLLEPKNQVNDAIILSVERDLSLKNLLCIPGALDMMGYGVRIQQLEGGCVLDMLFTDGVLKMHDLVINTDTIVLFRNLLAHELCGTRLTPYIKSYITFLSQLVSSPEDVVTLRRQGIVMHSLLNDEELVNEIRGLAKEVAFVDYDLKKCYLQTVIRQLRFVVGRRRNLWMREMKLRYQIDNPTVIVAILGMYLAIIQTVFAVLPYVQGRR